MTRRILSLIISFIIFTSCSFLTKKVESLVTQDELLVEPLSDTKTTLTKPTTNSKNLFCFQKNRTHLLLEDESTIKFYRPLIPTIFESKNYSFTQKAAMLSLVEMSRRPDLASPTARIQYYLRFNNKDYYYDLKPSTQESNIKWPLIKGVEILLKNLDASKGLPQIADTLEKLLPINMNISPELEIFLQNNRAEFLKNSRLTETFFKGDELLTRHEYFKRSSLKNLITNYYSKKISSDNLYESSKNSLVNIHTNEIGLGLKCNVDLNEDNALKEKLSFNEQNKYHYFAMTEGDNVFIAVTSSIIPKSFGNIDGTHFLNTQSGLTPLPICLFSNKLQDIALFSLGERDPAQHLKHFISYEIARVDSFQSLEKLLNFSRHLFLNDPDRILYESKKGRKAQLDFFLTMNFPIYHVDSLGDVFGVAKFKGKKTEDKSLIVDDRSQARIWCGP